MKSVFYVVVVGAFLSRFFPSHFFSALYSAPVGNTAAPQLIQKGFFIPKDWCVDMRFGYEGDFVSDARLEGSSGDVDDYSMSTNSGTVTLNAVDRFDVYTVLGSSRSSAEWRFLSTEGVLQNLEMETEHDFLWGVGLRAILLRWKEFDVGMGGRFSSVYNHPTWLTIDGINQSVSGTHLRWREWQMNFDVSYHIDLLTPYLGIKYSYTKAQIGTFGVPIADHGALRATLRSRIPVGVYLGCSLSTGEYFMLNIEGRLVDEEAVTISGDLRF